MGIKKNKSFFVEGSGKAIVAGENGKMAYIHLQDAQFEFSSKMEDIYGGESNSSLYSYQTEKSGTVTFTNASMDAASVAITQGVNVATNPTLFAMDEEVTVGTEGTITLTHQDTADMATLYLSDEDGTVVKVTDGKVDSAYNGKKLLATYAYTVTDGAVGVDVKNVSVPGYCAIFFRSKPVKQKDGRILRQHIILYKTRSDGSLKFDFKQKNAFAPELKFNIVDPERADQKFWSYSVEDCTESEAGNKDVVTPAGQ